jgi:hypothetical protein
MLDHFVPHIPTRDWAVVFLRHLAIFQPFIEYLVEQLYDDNNREVVLRYQFSL